MGIKEQKIKTAVFFSMEVARWYLLIALFYFGPITLFSQYQNYTHYTIDDGFLSMITYDVVQDHEGYIWVATDAGLSRFNGKEFKNYGIKEGLEQNEVIALIKDNHNRIWINSSGSVSYLKNEEFKVVNIEESNKLHWNFEILNDGDHHTWILSKGVLNYYNEQKNRSDLILNSYEDHYNLIGAKQDTSLILHNSNIEFRVNGQITKRIHLPNSFSGDNMQWQKYVLEENYLIYSGKNGIQKLNLETQEHTILSNEFSGVRSLKKDGNRLWISAKNNGIISLEILENKVVKKELFLQDKLCSNLILDKNNNLWVSTYGDGIYFFPKQYKGISNFSKEKNEVYGGLQSILVDEENIYIGKLNGDLLKINPQGVESFSYDFYREGPINRMLKLQKISDSEIVIASDDGILLFDGSQIKVKHAVASKNVIVNNDSLFINNYHASYRMSIDDFKKSKGTILQSQLYKSKKIKSKIDGRAYSGFMDSKGNYWIGHTNEGLIEYRADGTKVSHTLNNNILKVNISDIIELNNGSICLATNGEGLLIVNHHGIQQIDISNGLSSDICYDLKVKGNNLFVGTNKGINIIEFIDTGTDRYTINIVDVMNGLINNDARGIELGGDSLYVVTQGGMSILKLSSLEKVHHQESIQIESVKVNQKQIAHADTTILDHLQNSIQINFNTLSYIRNQQSVYAYKMLGIDKEWIYSKSNEIHYNDLQPGTYHFKIKPAAAKDDSFINSRYFIIEPHFTQTYWFKILFVMFLLASVLTSMLYFIGRDQKKELENLVEKRTAELKEKISDIDETNKKLAKSNSELERYAYVASHDLKSPLRSVASFIQLLSRKNQTKFDSKDKEYLRFISSSVNKMNQVIQDLLTLSKIGATEDEKVLINTKNLIEGVMINNDFIIKNKNATINLVGDFPMIAAHPSELSSLFQNFIANAIKYNESEQPIVNISVNKLNDKYVFAIQDNGIGINPKYGNKIFDLFQRLHTDNEYSGTGIGLAICKKIIEKNGGRIWFGSVVNEGTTFYFSFPDLNLEDSEEIIESKIEAKA